ncbi:uncharacterized protein LOC109815790 [Cajanus cajan]|uniref:Uncharacterized protein n=1 Tax=Cajanus cajan TaxID=3821 RepID=A0A151RUA8_CAJCA|nr:uncharacterized protein LOC109815790 [Cajanus cajan]KYP46132.1 hypothetical protein KK1_032299 [Cajanus cajan]
MVGFYDLSDTDDSAVEEIISQAQDACVLDQIAAINCSGITDTVLPTHLETRFRNLKSFPPTKPKPKPKPNSQAPTFSTLNHQTPNFSSDQASPNVPGEKPKHGSLYSASSPSSDDSSMSWVFRPSQKHGSKENSVTSRSLSPPPRKGCLWFSPKKKEKKKSKENWGDEFLSELGSFSSSKKEQQKMLKKAMKEEEKVSREAEKIVQWAKQASARMNVSHIDGELSDG